MKTVIVLGRHNDESDARQLLAAACAAGAQPDDIAVWQFAEGTLQQGMETLPAVAVCLIEVSGPALPGAAAKNLATRLVPMPELLLFFGDRFGNDVAAELSALTSAFCALDITGINRANGGLTVHRRVYGLHLKCELPCTGLPVVLSVAQDAFSPLPGAGTPEVNSQKAYLHAEWCENLSITQACNTKSLQDYDVILIGGRGLGSAENARRLEYLAKLMHAGLGATRPAVFNGWLPLESLVGASGERVAPKLCIVFGASGCTPLVLGLEKSKTILAVNIDGEADIFSSCDIGLVADCNAVIEEMIASLEKHS